MSDQTHKLKIGDPVLFWGKRMHVVELDFVHIRDTTGNRYYLPASDLIPYNDEIKIGKNVRHTVTQYKGEVTDIKGDRVLVWVPQKGTWVNWGINKVELINEREEPGYGQQSSCVTAKSNSAE